MILESEKALWQAENDLHEAVRKVRWLRAVVEDCRRDFLTDVKAARGGSGPPSREDKLAVKKQELDKLEAQACSSGG